MNIAHIGSDRQMKASIGLSIDLGYQSFESNYSAKPVLIPFKNTQK